MNAVNNNAIALGSMGLFLTAFGVNDLRNEVEWNYLKGIPTLIGSAAILASVYQSHKFVVDGKYSFSNIIKVCLVAAAVIGSNVVYMTSSYEPIDPCKTDPALWYCQKNQTQSADQVINLGIPL